MMASSRRYHHARLGLMAVSAILINSCLSLVLADRICQPFHWSTRTCHQHEEQSFAMLVVLCFMALMMVVLGACIWYFLESLPLWNPDQRLNNMRQYVDEDAARYYEHVPSTTQVTPIRHRSKEFEHQGVSEAYDSKISVDNSTGSPFVDDKLLRVQEPGQQGDLKPLTRQ